jgi:hypothetical protein
VARRTKITGKLTAPPFRIVESRGPPRGDLGGLSGRPGACRRGQVAISYTDGKRTVNACVARRALKSILGRRS